MLIKKWKKVGAPEILAEGYGKTFSKQKFEDHKGKITDFFFFDQKNWASVLALTNDKKIILVKQFKQGAEKIIDELPAGVADKNGEKDEELIKRELLEETGYEAAEIIPLGRIPMNSRNSHAEGILFLAKNCVKKTEPSLEDSEEIEVITISIEEFIVKALNGQLETWDAYVILLRALKFLELDITPFEKSP